MPAVTQTVSQTVNEPERIVYVYSAAAPQVKGGTLPKTGLPLAIPALSSLGLGATGIAGIRTRGRKGFIEENL